MQFGCERNASANSSAGPSSVGGGNSAVERRFDRRVAEIGPEHVELRSERDGTEERLANDWLFALTGYTPDTSFPRRLGVAVDQSTGVPQHDPATLDTKVPGLFIAGVIAAGRDANRLFIQNG